MWSVLLNYFSFIIRHCVLVLFYININIENRIRKLISYKIEELCEIIGDIILKVYIERYLFIFF